jgi:hypothetical protein
MDYEQAALGILIPPLDGGRCGVKKIQFLYPDQRSKCVVTTYIAIILLF